MKKKIRAYAIGALVTVLALGAYEAIRHVYKSAPPSQEAQVHQIQNFKVDPSWILEGKPDFKATEFFHSSDGKTVSGIFECEPSKFEWHYRYDEAVYIIDGVVDVDYMGKQFTLQAGQSAFFRAGTRATWTVRQHIRKTWTLYDPGKPARGLAQFLE